MVAGAAAEGKGMGDRFKGAGNGFEQGREAAKRIIASGMSSLGVVSLQDLPSSLLHKEIQQIIAKQQTAMQDYLRPHKALITELAKILIHDEKVSGEFLRRRLAEYRVAEIA